MKIKSLLMMAVCALVMASCSSYKNVPYLQNAEEIKALQAEMPLYDAKIMQGLADSDSEHHGAGSCSSLQLDGTNSSEFGNFPINVFSTHLTAVFG